MTLSQPRHPVLDQQFHLHTPLGGSGLTSVYRATHSTGQDVIVKLIDSTETFFDELARLYSLDSCLYFSSCLYNYPPASACGREVPLQPAAAPAAEGNLAEMGALVLEVADGEPLSQIMSELSDMEMVNVLLEITYALTELEKRGLAHGDLRPENVFFDRETGEINVVDMGYYIGKYGADIKGLSPEHATGAELGPAADVYMYAHHFLVPLRQKGRLRRVIRQCLRTDPETRPSLEVIRTALRQRRRKMLPKQSLEIMFGFLRPLNLAAWAVLVFLGIIVLPYIQGNKKVNWQRDRARLLTKENLPTAELVSRLRDLLAVSTGPDRELLIRDIANKTREMGLVKPLGEEDLAKPIAVFAFNANPVIIGRDEIYRLGDWVQLENSFGYIASIEYYRIQLVYESSLSWHVFDRPSFNVAEAYSKEVALVWKNQNNMDRLFEAIDQLNLPESLGQSKTQDLLSENGSIAGLFVTNTPVGVLQAIDEFVLADAHEAFVSKDQAHQLFVFFKFMRFECDDDDASSLIPLLEQTLGCRVRIDPSLHSKKITITSYNISWQNLLTELGIQWHTEKDDYGKILVLKGVEP